MGKRRAVKLNAGEERRAAELNALADQYTKKGAALGGPPDWKVKYAEEKLNQCRHMLEFSVASDGGPHNDLAGPARRTATGACGNPPSNSSQAGAEKAAGVGTLRALP